MKERTGTDTPDGSDHSTIATCRPIGHLPTHAAAQVAIDTPAKSSVGEKIYGGDRPTTEKQTDSLQDGSAEPGTASTVQASLRRTATREIENCDTTDHERTTAENQERPGEAGWRTSGRASNGGQEESRVESDGAADAAHIKKEPQLQDQTNLLPTKQVVLVCIGLTCALFCSNLDQTM